MKHAEKGVQTNLSSQKKDEEVLQREEEIKVSFLATQLIEKFSDNQGTICTVWIGYIIIFVITIGYFYFDDFEMKLCEVPYLLIIVNLQSGCMSRTNIVDIRTSLEVVPQVTQEMASYSLCCFAKSMGKDSTEYQQAERFSFDGDSSP